MYVATYIHCQRKVAGKYGTVMHIIYPTYHPVVHGKILLIARGLEMHRYDFLPIFRYTKC